MRLLNLFSGEQFSFPVHRWLAKDQAGGEISVELPVLQQGQPILPGKHNTTSAKSDPRPMSIEVIVFHRALYYFLAATTLFLLCFPIVTVHTQVKS